MGDPLESDPQQGMESAARGLSFWAAIGTGGKTTGSRGALASLQDEPFGRWILGAIGLGVIGIGIAQAYKGYNEKYKEGLKPEAKGKQWIDVASKLGLYARAMVFGVIGVMLITAAWQSDRFEAGGLGKGLQTLQQQPYGWILLGLVSLGLICFAIYSFIEARYRKV